MEDAVTFTSALAKTTEAMGLNVLLSFHGLSKEGLRKSFH